MKRKKGILLLVVGLLILIPSIVLAAQPTVELSGVLNAKPGDTVAYDIKINSSGDTRASKYEANLEYDQNILELKSITAKSWTKESGSSDLNFSYQDGISGSSTIATITFKVKDNVPKQTTNIALKDIKITTLDEEDSSSIVTISENASHKVSLSVKSTDNTLKDLKVDGKTIEDFKKDNYEYELSVSSDTDEVEIKATPTNANATFEEGFGNRDVKLDYGENEVLIKVKAESGEIQVYKLLITREDDRNTNNDLKEIIINSGRIKLELSKNKVNYTIKTYKLKELEIDAVPVDEKAKVEIEIPDEIIVGDNVVTITVTSETGEEKVYTLTFENSDKELDTKLKNLYIKGYNIDFDKNTMVYQIVYNKKYKNGLDFSIVTADDEELVGYTIFYNGEEVTDDTNISLKPGDKYEIRVYPLGLEEGDSSETTTYTIEIVKDKRVSFFLILEILIALVLFVLIIVQVVKRNKKRKNNANQENNNNVVSNEKLQEEVNKTKVIDTDELNKINELDKE